MGFILFGAESSMQDNWFSSLAKVFAILVTESCPQANRFGMRPALHIAPLEACTFMPRHLQELFVIRSMRSQLFQQVHKSLLGDL